MNPAAIRCAVVIEDHDVHAKLAVLLLKKLGVKQVLRAENGALGLDLIRRESPELIVCDLDMPQVDGMGVLRELNKLSKVPSILLVSAVGKDVLHVVEKLANVYRFDVIGVVEKPLGLERLRSLLSTHGEVPARTGGAPTPQTLSEEELRQALVEDRFVPFFEPKIRREDAQCVGAELLARLLAPNGSIIPPFRFIEGMEQLQLIDQMTLRIFEKALANLQDWDASGFEASVSLNISPQMLDDAELPAKLLELADRYQIAAGRITLEIVETAAVQGDADIVSERFENLARLRVKGFLLSMDDFGTGYSSMAQISDIPITELKIDRQFCMEACAQPKARAICESGVNLARQIEVKSCAEGIENHAIFNLLYDLGADTFQGYLFTKPLPADEFYSWTTAWNRDVDLPTLYHQLDA